jgi:hypothetical protein
MADLDLRPLSLGEILDRTFSLYRRNFLLFVGITALPQVFVLALHLGQVFLTMGATGGKQVQPGMAAFGAIGALLGIIVYFLAYLYAQGGTVYAISDLYLGRPTSIGAALRRMRGEAGTLFGVLLLNGLAIFAGLILLIIPGIYLGCRLMTCVPAALLENLGPRDSLSRSYNLTKDFAGRSFVIYILYFALLYGAFLLFSFPFLMGIALTGKDPAMMVMWMSLSQVGSSIATILVTPILTIATTVFYYDLRVRKEAFDLQMMMNPGGSVLPAGAAVPSVLS